MGIKKITLKKNAVTDLRARKHVISQERSQFLIDNFKKNKDEILNPKLQKKDNKVGILPLSECFNANVVRQLLDLPNCEGLRIHSGLNEDFQMVFVLRAVDENGKDIVSDIEKPPENTMMARSFITVKADNYSLDDAQRVPPWPEKSI